MKVSIDKSKCIGCGLCASMCVEVFELGDDGKAVVKSPEGCSKCDCESIASNCPVDAIIIEK